MKEPRSPRGKPVWRASIEPVMMVVQALGWSIRKAGGWLHRQGSELETWAHARRPKEPTT